MFPSILHKFCLYRCIWNVLNELLSWSWYGYWIVSTNWWTSEHHTENKLTVTSYWLCGLLGISFIKIYIYIYIYIYNYIYIILEPFHKVQTADGCSVPGIWQIYGLKTGWWLCSPHSLPSFSTRSREVDQITLKLIFFRSYIRNISMQRPELYLSQIMSTHLKGSPYLIQL